VSFSFAVDLHLLVICGSDGHRFIPLGRCCKDFLLSEDVFERNDKSLDKLEFEGSGFFLLISTPFTLLADS